MFWKKSIVLFAGVLATLLLLEATLFIIGLWHNHSTRVAHESSKEKYDFTILSLGNSHTQGAGAAPGRGYPEQLQEQLTRRFPNLSVRVVNRGISNATSANVLRNLQAWLEETRPDLVTLRMGEPNQWNFSDFYLYLHKKQGRQPSWSDVFLKLRSVRLFQRLIYDLKSSPEKTQALNLEAMSWLDIMQNSGLEETYTRLTETSKKEFHDSLEGYYDRHKNEHYIAFILSRVYLHRGDFEKTAIWLERVVQNVDFFHVLAYKLFNALKPHAMNNESLAPRMANLETLFNRHLPSPEDLDSMMRFSPTEYEKTIKPGQKLGREELLLQSVRMEPGQAEHVSTYVKIFLIEKHRYEDAMLNLQSFHFYNTGLHKCGHCFRKIYRNARKYNPEVIPQLDAAVEKFNHAYKEKFGVESQTRFKSGFSHIDWAIDDISETISILESKGIHYVVLSYPPSPLKKRRDLDEHIRSFALEKRLPFIDSDKNLKEKFDLLPDKERLSHYALMGPLDEHMNEKGYTLLAKELADFISTNYLEHK